MEAFALGNVNSFSLCFRRLSISGAVLENVPKQTKDAVFTGEKFQLPTMIITAF